MCMCLVKENLLKIICLIYINFTQLSLDRWNFIDQKPTLNKISVLKDLEVFISDVLMEKILVEKYNEKENASTSKASAHKGKDILDFDEKLFVYFMESYGRICQVEKDHIKVLLYRNWCYWYFQCCCGYLIHSPWVDCFFFMSELRIESCAFKFVHDFFLA